MVASMIYDSPCGMSASRFALSQQLVKFPNLLLVQPFSKCCFIGSDPRLSALPANFVGTKYVASSVSLAVILNANVAGKRLPRHYDPKLSAMEPDDKNTLVTGYRCDLPDDECDRTR